MRLSEMFDCVQIIAHTPPLAWMLLNAKLKKAEGNEVNQLVQIIVASLLKPREGVQEMAFYLDNVLNLLPEKYTTQKMECAHEFLVHLFELIGADVWTYRPLDIIQSDVHFTYNCAGCGFYRNDNVDHCTTISLSLPRTEDGKLLESYSLQNMLTDYSACRNEMEKTEKLCSHCNSIQLSSEQISFRKTGAVLAVHIKFMGSDGKKFCVPVTAEPMLSIVVSSQTVEYQLAGIVYHSGPNSSSGHYITRIRYLDGWFETNDERLYGAQGPYIEHINTKMKNTLVPLLVFYTRTGQVHDAAIQSRLRSMASTFQTFPLEELR